MIGRDIMTSLRPRHPASWAAIGVVMLILILVVASPLTRAPRTAGAASSGSGTGGLACMTTVRPTIAVVLSYHDEYEWQRQVLDGLESALDGAADVLYHRMRTIGVSSDEELKARGDAAIQWVADIDPDAIIVVDDNAMRLVGDSPDLPIGVPLIFCGINWPASAYDLPRPNVSGMVEVSPARHIIERLGDSLTEGDLLVILGSDRPTNRAQAEGFLRVARERGFMARAEFISDFKDWRERFAELQSEADMLHILNNAGIRDWDDDAARAFVLEHTGTLTTSEYRWMSSFVVLSAFKRGEEQGAWAGFEALRRTRSEGNRVAPIVMNRDVEYMINDALLGHSDHELPAALRLLAETDR